MSRELDIEQLFQEQLAGESPLPRGGSHLSREECREFIGTLRGKHVLITGAASGIGRDLARIAAKCGSSVSCGDLNYDAVQKVVKEITKSYGKAMAHRVSTTDWESQVAFFKAAEERFGPIDIVCPFAGVGERLHPGFEDDVLDARGRVDKPLTMTLEVNLIGVVYSTKLAYHYLRKHPERKGKTLVFMGSALGWHPMPQAPMYCAAKAGVHGLMRSAFFELHKHDIRTSAICPWFVETAIIEPLYRAALVGCRWAEMDAVQSAIIAAVSRPDQDGSCLFVDPEGVLAIPFEATTVGQSKVYDQLDERGRFTPGIWVQPVALLKLAQIYASMYLGRKARLLIAFFVLLLIWRRRSKVV